MPKPLFFYIIPPIVRFLYIERKVDMLLILVSVSSGCDFDIGKVFPVLAKYGAKPLSEEDRDKIQVEVLNLIEDYRFGIAVKIPAELPKPDVNTLITECSEAADRVFFALDRRKVDALGIAS